LPCGFDNYTYKLTYSFTCYQ